MGGKYNTNKQKVKQISKIITQNDSLCFMQVFFNYKCTFEYIVLYRKWFLEC